jgi:protein-arginine kinase activator protein McsA
LRAELAELPRPPRIDLAHFFQRLTLLRYSQVPAALPDIPPHVTCPNCGLTYAEFSAVGLAGCAACYSAFRPAVDYALAVLHGVR